MIKASLGGGISTFPTLRRNEKPWKVILESLTSLHDMGFSINWAEYHRDFEESCHLLTLPSYAFDNKNYWVSYRNDWTLRKGDPLPTVNAGGEARAATEKLSASVHRIFEENYDCSEPTVTYESDLCCSELHSAICGHRVNGSALCPSVHS